MIVLDELLMVHPIPKPLGNKKGTGRGPFFDSCVYAAGASPPSAGASAGASVAGVASAGAAAGVVFCDSSAPVAGAFWSVFCSSIDVCF